MIIICTLQIHNIGIQHQSTLNSLLTTVENLRVSLSSDNIESSVFGIISDDVAISSEPSTQNIIYTSEAPIQTQGDILTEITSKNENSQGSQSTLLISDNNPEISSIIKNEEQDSSGIDDILTTGKFCQVCITANIP